MTVSVTESFPVGLDALWREAGHPARVSKTVPMLRDFSAPETLTVGAPLSETHTILGWPQRYQGEVLVIEERKVWGMSSKPSEPGPCSLPHDVFYGFSEQGGRSSLRITCSFECRGLLALPFVPKLVAWAMKLTLLKLLKTVGLRLRAMPCAAHC